MLVGLAPVIPVPVVYIPVLVAGSPVVIEAVSPAVHRIPALSHIAIAAPVFPAAVVILFCSSVHNGYFI
jgi:hypothetical protein